MHDLSISQAIARTVLKEARDQKAKEILSIEIEIGEFTFLNPEQVRFWLKEIFKESIAKEAKVHIKKVYSQIRCQDCHWRGRMNVKDDPLYHTYFFIPKCPKCGSSSLKIEKGRECRVRKIRVRL